MDQKMLDPPSSSSKLLTFDASLANTFIVKREWEGLDNNLSKFVATILKKTPDEVVMMHPGLFMIPREERLLDMLIDLKFEEAASFCLESVELLRGCQGRFIPLDLTCKIDDLNTILKTRFMPAVRRSAERIETSVSDYIHLYFPSAIRRDNDEVEGLWQFAIMELPKPDKRSRQHAFRCLACGWICPGSRKHMRMHIMQDCKVTEDILDRLKAIDETRGVPTLETVEYLSKNRKTMSESVASSSDTHLESLVSGEVSSATGPKSSSSTDVEDKKARKELISDANSPCLGTPAKKMKSHLAVSQAPTMPSYPDPKHLFQMVKTLKNVTGALTPQISTCVAVPEDQIFFLEQVSALQNVAMDLFRFAVDVPASVPGSASAQVPKDDGGHASAKIIPAEHDG